MDLAMGEGNLNGYPRENGYPSENYEIIHKEKKMEKHVEESINEKSNSGESLEGNDKFQRNNGNNLEREIRKRIEKAEVNGTNEKYPKYISKEYKVHWRERERIQKVINKEKELEKDFYKREKEWIELEDQIKNDTYKEWNKFLQIKKKDIAKMIELDLKGEQENANMSSSKKREIRNSKRKKEKELDDLDRLNEMEEIKEMEEMQKKKEQEERDKVEEEEEEGETTHPVEEDDKTCQSKAIKHFENQDQKQSNNFSERATEESNKSSKDYANEAKLKSNFFMNALSFVFDRNSDNKMEQIKEEKSSSDVTGKSHRNPNENVECALNQMKSGHKAFHKANAPNSEEMNPEHSDTNRIEENGADASGADTSGADASGADTSGADANESDANESDANEPNGQGEVNKKKLRGRKRKTNATEHINIKVNDKNKKSKITDSEEGVNKMSTRKALHNVFSTNNEDELFTKKNVEGTRLDNDVDKKNQAEGEEKGGGEEEGEGEEGEKMKTIDIIENSKKILEKVPSSEEEIFNYPLNWKVLNLKDNIGNKLKPWIYKKITEYIGTDEKEIIEEISNYFVQQILKETSPKDMLVEAEKFLDSDGKKFILNMYKLIIFEQIKVTSTA
ncbi:hypothetical protein, conserved [Plasmodium gonderi]|uniref:PWI domain-containing protein n=1 Tax=Plasmodium gonderi TaxID=77519 RepID=A0A1Y1JHA9_PLAGO|nr:hypothetical protein, conserved [Plasmodium gonderi]GAW81919.1 hypothetical protein, conserved [Plasmodium gonderi]